MKKVILISVFVASSLFAGSYGNNGYSGYGNNSKANEPVERGYAKAGDKNYENEQIDRNLYGEKNAYQGSRPGDSDWGERNLKHLQEKR